MDIEWAKDGVSKELYIVQARPETVQSQKSKQVLEEYYLKQKSDVIVSGKSVGSKIANGSACLIKSVKDIHKFKPGQILVTEPIPPMLNRVMICSRYITSKFVFQDVYNPLGVGLALEQTRAGSLLIGSTREFVGYNRNVTPEGIQAVLKHALSFVPDIGKLNIIRSFAGLRPHTPYGMPILGRAKGVEGFITAAGHAGDGSQAQGRHADGQSGLGK